MKFECVNELKKVFGKVREISLVIRKNLVCPAVGISVGPGYPKDVGPLSRSSNEALRSEIDLNV